MTYCLVAAVQKYLPVGSLAQEVAARHTVSVTYHEGFWVATAAAAPVIALANTVSMSDIGKAYFGGPRSRVPIIKRKTGGFVFFSSLGIYSSQIFVLWSSLFALYQQTDQNSILVHTVIILTVGGLLMVFLNFVVIAMMNATDDDDDVP